jgi:gliding motility-associated-like protein
MITLLKIKATTIVIVLFSITLQLNAQSPGTLQSSDTVCTGNNSGILSLAGNAGAIVRWEFAYSSGGPWSTIAITQPNYVYQNLLQTIFFRVITQVGILPELYSNVVQITCIQAAPPFSINAPTLQCVQGQSTASVTSPTNSGVYWEYSTNNWATVNQLGTGLSNTVIMTAPTQAYKLRAFKNNFFCPAVYSNTLNITPAQLSNAGTITGTTQICSVANSCTLTVANTSGTILNWESAFTPAGPFTPIGGSTSLTGLPLANLIQTTYYRTTAQNGNCPIAASQIHTLQVSQASIGGFVTGSYSLCAGTTAATLILQGNTGNVLEWQAFAGNVWQSLPATANTVIALSPSTTGNYRAIVQNGVCNAATSNSHTLTVHPKPLASFIVNNVCAQSATTFSNQSQGSFFSQWYFGDGSTSSIFSPSHTYSLAGNYVAKLKCISGFGCVDSISTASVVYPLPMVSFINNDSLCDGSTYNFFNNSSIGTGSITSVTYNFGDGTSQIGQNASHTFSSSGSYQVTQTAQSNFACSNSTIKQVHVLPNPTANFSAGNICKNQNLNFQNLSTLSNGYILYKWHFGTGDSSNAFQPNYAFQQAGTYFVQLQARSNYYCLSIITKSLLVHPVPGLSLQNYSVCANASASIQAQITSSTNISNISFSFGDGSTSTQLQNQHSYSMPGIYPISLKITTDSNCISTASAQVQVYHQPKASFVTEDACENTSVKISNLSIISLGSLNHLWQLNKSQNFTDAVPSLTLLTAGTQTLQLVVTSNYGCKDSITDLLQIHPKPDCKIVEFTPCQNTPQLISATSSVTSGQVTEYTWLRNKSFLSSAQQFSVSFENSGSETLALRCKTEKGCEASDTLVVAIAPLAKASFSNSLACSNTTVQLLNTSTSEAPNFNSTWKVDDTITESLNLSLNKPLPGYHKVSLITTTDKGCKDSTQQSVFISAAPDLLIEADTSFNLGEQKYLQVKGASTYTWLPENYLSNAFADYVLCSPQNNITYTLFAQSPHGCESTAILPIRVKKDYVLEVFNIITPNGNGLNEHFHINNIEAYPGNKVMVFDQNNQIVFEQKNYQNTWQGRNARGELLAPGTYFYRINFEDSDKVLMGSLVVIGD